MTRRCFVIPWRVTIEPSASRVMDIGPPSHRRETRSRRVSSPRAAKSRASPFDLWRTGKTVLCEISLDQFDHHSPASVVRGERLRPALKRYLIEARLRDSQQDTLLFPASAQKPQASSVRPNNQRCARQREDASGKKTAVPDPAFQPQFRT